MILNYNCFDIMKMMKDDCVDHVITSPPYNRKRNDKYNHYNDTLVNYEDFLISSIKECIRISNGYVFYNIQKNYYNKIEVFKIIGEFSESLLDIIIWNKSNPMPGPGATVCNAYEFILVFSKNKKSLRSNNTYTKNSITTGVYSKNKYSKIHRALMNPEVSDFLIDNFTQENELIFDPFAGLATTWLSCVSKGRLFLGTELKEEYCVIAKERLRSYI